MSQYYEFLYYPKNKGAYTESFSIGPELIQHLISFPLKWESN